jgi:plastocyanin
MGSTFIPDPITVTAGTTVTWTNLESEDHTVTSNDGLFDTPLWFRDSFSFTFTEPGTYEYYCIPHEDDDMLGKVIVE